MKVFLLVLVVFVVFTFAVINAAQHFSKPAPAQIVKPIESLGKSCSVYSDVHYDRCINNIIEAKTRCSGLKNSAGYVECIKKYGGL